MERAGITQTRSVILDHHIEPECDTAPACLVVTRRKVEYSLGEVVFGSYRRLFAIVVEICERKSKSGEVEAFLDLRSVRPAPCCRLTLVRMVSKRHAVAEGNVTLLVVLSYSQLMTSGLSIRSSPMAMDG